MDLRLNFQLASNYTSNSQIARILTENWTEEEVFCPNCGEQYLNKSFANTPVTDFVCNKCKETYELKSQKNRFGRKINDGAYKTMISKLNEGSAPNLFLLNYDITRYEVTNFVVVPKQFFIPSLIEKRPPLTGTAKRHGWIGCNILFNEIPNSGKIFFIKEGRVIPKKEVINNWKKVLFIKKEENISAKGWLLDVIKCIEKLNVKTFTLDELYKFEDLLRGKHPTNRHVRDKIRQQLQILRDKGYIRFTGRGKYTLN